MVPSASPTLGRFDYAFLLPDVSGTPIQHSTESPSTSPSFFRFDSLLEETVD
jgi:hypothetical protein